MFWDKNEWHEAGTNIGLVAIVIEGDLMNPSGFMYTEWDGSSITLFDSAQGDPYMYQRISSFNSGL